MTRAVLVRGCTVLFRLEEQASSCMAVRNRDACLELAGSASNVPTSKW